METCSFVCHLLIPPLALVYFAWVVLEEESLESWGISYFPPTQWSIYAPVSALLIFLAAPILYAALNSTTVPRLDSMDTLRDVYTRDPDSSQSTWIAQKVPVEDTLPEICDLDPSSLMWYSGGVKSSK